MPIVPVNYRGDDPFRPLDDIDKILKDDFAPVTFTTTRARVGTWLEFSGAGVRKPGGEVAYAAAPTWSDYDATGVSGHPDAYRLGLITMLVGAHRGRTRYFKRVAPQNAIVTGSPLTVYPAITGAGDVTPINTAAGATVCETNDGLLGLAGTVTSPFVAVCLRAETNGYIEYYKY